MIFENGDRIVFAGDSVTEMGSTNPVGEFGDGLGHGYVRMVDNMLLAWYPEINIRVINSGIGGNSSRELLARFDRDVVSMRPDWVSICIGINDVWRQFHSPDNPGNAVFPDEYEANIEKMILAVKGKVKGIFILSPFLVEPLKQEAMRGRMDEYTAICKKLADKYDCIFVDFQAMYDELCKVQHSARVAWDRVHPNEMGATLMAKTFLKQVGFDFNK